MQTHSNPIATRLKTLCLDIKPKLYEISETEWRLIPGTNKWSKLQILGHLIDSAANNHQRFIRCRYEHIPTIVYDQNQWNTLNHYDKSNVHLIIDLWFAYNTHLAHVMEETEISDVQKLCNTGGELPYTLEWLMQDYLEHLEHHLHQIIEY